jgi:predicted Fe-Mo cluster-binding NifX family protein
MKTRIAAVTDDGKTISAHFGRATQYTVVTAEDSQVQVRETRPKANHHDFQHEGSHHGHEDHGTHGRGFGRDAGRKHRLMFASIQDCQVVLARGMGQGARRGLEGMGIQVILTDVKEIDRAVQAYLDGQLVDHPERLH